MCAGPRPGCGQRTHRPHAGWPSDAESVEMQMEMEVKVEMEMVMALAMEEDAFREGELEAGSNAQGYS